MRIDAHQHFWKYSAAEYDWIDDTMPALRRDFMPADSQREMTLVGLDACVAVQARQTIEETRWLLGLAGAHPSIAGVVGWIDLRADDVEAQIAAFAEHPKLVGVRHVVQSEPDDRFLLRPDFCRGISMLEAAGLAYDILIYSRQLPAAVEFAARFPRQRFVLDHLAKPPIRSREMREWEQNFRALAARPNVMAKLSGLVTEADWHHWTADDIRPYLDVAFDAFGAERLMIGSDWPVCTLAGDYARVMRVVIDYVAKRPQHEQDAVLGANAQRFWNLNHVSQRSAALPAFARRKLSRASARSRRSAKRGGG
jgi:L-fuconolactonase